MQLNSAFYGAEAAISFQHLFEPAFTAEGLSW